MPGVLKINPRKRVVHSTFFGVVTDEEFLGHGETIAWHPNFRPDYDEIVDLRMVTDAQVTTSVMQDWPDAGVSSTPPQTM